MFLKIAIFIISSLAYQYQAAVDNNRMPTVDSVLQQVQQEIKDENYDGKINCIDYAIAFYSFCPTAEIVVVRHRHAFIKLGDRYIEPQSKPGDEYDALVIWKGVFTEADIIKWPAYEDEAVRKRWYYTDKGWRWRQYYYLKDGI